MDEFLEAIFGIACSFLLLLAGMLFILWSITTPPLWPAHLFVFMLGFVIIFLSFKGFAYFVGR